MESENLDEQLPAMDGTLSCDVEHTQPGKISKRFILLVTCLCALCDCLLLSVIGKKPVMCCHYKQI